MRKFFSIFALIGILSLAVGSGISQAAIDHNGIDGKIIVKASNSNSGEGSSGGNDGDGGSGGGDNWKE